MDAWSQIKFVVLGIIQNQKGEVLLIRRVKEEKGKDGSILRWAFPGGRLHPNESRAECVKREVMEETGYEVSPMYQLNVRRHPQINMEISYWLCRLVAEKPKQPPSEPYEIAEVRWVKPNELEELITTDIDPSVRKALGLKAKPAS